MSGPRTSSLVIIATMLLIAMADVGNTVAEGSRDRLTADEMFGQTDLGQGPIDNSYFAPIGDVEPAKHALSGRLVIPRTEGFVFGAFPGVALRMFVSGDRLLPVTRDIPRRGQSRPARRPY